MAEDSNTITIDDKVFKDIPEEIYNLIACQYDFINSRILFSEDISNEDILDEDLDAIEMIEALHDRYTDKDISDEDLDAAAIISCGRKIDWP